MPAGTLVGSGGAACQLGGREGEQPCNTGRRHTGAQRWDPGDRARTVVRVGETFGPLSTTYARVGGVEAAAVPLVSRGRPRSPRRCGKAWTGPVIHFVLLI